MDLDTQQPNQRLRHARLERGWSQQRVAEQIETSENVVSRWERGERMPSPFYQEKLCQLFGKNAEELGFLKKSAGFERGHKYNQSSGKSSRNLIIETDGCFSFGKLKTTSMVLDGDGTEAYLPTNIRTYYDPVPATFFEEIMQAKEQIKQEQEEKQRNGEPYQWNGEKYHLSKVVISREPVHESMTLGLWFKPRDHYTGLATRRCLDNPDFRKKYAPDDWYTPVLGMSCSMGIDLTVISSDGYTLLTQRGQNQSIHQNKFHGSVSEAVSPSFDRGTAGQAPDLYRCACRGLAEELGLQESVDFSVSDILFLSLSVDTHYALYGLRGMVKVKKSAKDILRDWHAGVKDKMENKMVFAVPFTAQEVCSFVFLHEPWAGGLVCLYHTLVHEFGREQVNSAISSY